MIARASNLTIRFYQKDGWTLEDLNKFCLQGEFKCYHPEDTSPYFILSQGSSVDIDELDKKVSKVKPMFKSQNALSKRELLDTI